MREFEIEFKEKGTFGKFIAKTEYNVKTNGFEATVSVLNNGNGQAFVHEHICSKGGELLWGYGFWNELRSKVLEFHNDLKPE